MVPGITLEHWLFEVQSKLGQLYSTQILLALSDGKSVSEAMKRYERLRYVKEVNCLVSTGTTVVGISASIYACAVTER